MQFKDKIKEILLKKKESQLTSCIWWWCVYFFKLVAEFPCNALSCGVGNLTFAFLLVWYDHHDLQWIQNCLLWFTVKLQTYMQVKDKLVKTRSWKGEQEVRGKLHCRASKCFLGFFMFSGQSCLIEVLILGFFWHAWTIYTGRNPTVVSLKRKCLQHLLPQLPSSPQHPLCHPLGQLESPEGGSRLVSLYLKQCWHCCGASSSPSLFSSSQWFDSNVASSVDAWKQDVITVKNKKNHDAFTVRTRKKKAR